MDEAVSDPFPEDLKIEILSKLPSTVEYRVFQSTFIIQVSFKH